jgi:hypothetical protein
MPNIVDKTTSVTGAVPPLKPLEVVASDAPKVGETVIAPDPLPSTVTPAESFDTAKSQAMASGDPKPLLKLAGNTDDPAAQASAVHVAKNVAAGTEQWNNLTTKIEDAGGVNTPQGRIEFQNQWRNNDNNPQYINALLQYAIGNKDAGRSLLSGGKQTTKITYDQNSGQPLQYKVDENGDIHAAFDGQKEISPQEFYQRTKFANGLDQTFGYLTDKANAQANAESTIKTAANANTSAAAAPGMATLYGQLGDALSGLKDLPPDVQAKALQFSSSSVGTSQTRSQALAALDQLIKSGSLKEGNEVDSKITAALGAEGIATVGTGGKIVFSDGKTKSINDLKQEQSSSNQSSSIEQKFNQTKQDLLAYLKTTSLAKDNPEGVLKLMSALEISKQIALKEATLPSNVFNIPTAGFGVTDPYARGRVQAAQGQFNSAVNIEFNDFVQKQLKNYPAGQSPRPGELEAAFTKQPAYQDLLNNYKATANAILKETPNYAPSVNTKDTGVNMPETAPAAPPPKKSNNKTVVDGASKPRRSMAEIYNTVR